MTTKEILGLKYSENEALFQKCLHKIKPFRNTDGEIPMIKLEKYIGLVQRKYSLQIDYICPTFIPDEENLYSATVRDTNTNRYLTYLYANTMYELFVKISILYFAVLNGKEFTLADWHGEKYKRQEKLKKVTNYEN